MLINVKVHCYIFKHNFVAVHSICISSVAEQKGDAGARGRYLYGGGGRQFRAAYVFLLHQ